MRHQGVRGYDVYCHVRNPDQVYQNIEKQSKEISEKEVRIKLVSREDCAKLSEVKEEWCGDYFKRYFEQEAQDGPLVLPQIQRGINKIVDTMETWCSKANVSSNLKGLVVHNFNVLKFLKILLYDKLDTRKLCKELDIKDFRSTSIPIVIVHNTK